MCFSSIKTNAGLLKKMFGIVSNVCRLHLFAFLSYVTKFLNIAFFFFHLEINETRCFVLLAILISVFFFFFTLNTKRQQTFWIISLILNDVYHKESLFSLSYILFLNGYAKFRQDLTFSLSQPHLLRHIHNENFTLQCLILKVAFDGVFSKIKK